MTSRVVEAGFESDSLGSAFHWYCEPVRWEIGEGELVIWPDAKTDYWQRTHYGFSADNGPFLYTPVTDDFVMTATVRFYPRHQYDQAGLMVRIDPQTWIKTSVEYEPDEPDKLGAVVTAYGYSDWSTQDYPLDANEIALRIERAGDDYLVAYAPAALPPDRASELAWTQIRMTHLPNPHAVPVLCGVYACCPTDAGYRAAFDFIRVEPA
ncbi:MAG: DUF1349 domain-containing protein [Anaerolineae bacterium]